MVAVAPVRGVLDAAEDENEKLQEMVDRCSEAQRDMLHQRGAALEATEAQLGLIGRMKGGSEDGESAEPTDPRVVSLVEQILRVRAAIEAQQQEKQRVAPTR